MTVGGASAQRYNTRTRVRHVVTTGTFSEVVENEWLARHVFVIYGNWGYEFRFFTENPNARLWSSLQLLTIGWTMVLATGDEGDGAAAATA